jgi:phosphoenolpyruvate-protein kinase (PTS system EI component)
MVGRASWCSISSNTNKLIGYKMAVYRQNPDGSLELVKPDTSLAVLIENIQEQQKEQGVEISPCLKDTLKFNNPTSEGE